MDVDTLAEAARDLLLSAPADFVAERTARQRATRSDDRDLATAIGKLRKPAAAAWVIDLLAHEGALDEAVELGPAIREAQANADPKEIAALRRQRASVVSALAQAGADLASDAGHPATAAVLDQVRATIEAAMADPHAGAAVRSGLLVQPLESAGFDDVDLDGTLAVPDAVPDAWSGSGAAPIPIEAGRRPRKASRASRPERRADPQPDHDPQPDRDPQPDHDPAADRRAARQAETAARTESRDADAALDAAETDLETAEEHRAALERDLEQAAAEVERLERARDDAEATSDRARDLLAAAQRHRRDLGR